MLFENHAVSEIMWETCDTGRKATDDNIIRRMRFACWINKATDTYSECAILTGFPRQRWLRKRASILRLQTHCLPYYLNILMIWNYSNRMQCQCLTSKSNRGSIADTITNLCFSHTKFVQRSSAPNTPQYPPPPDHILKPALKNVAL